MNDRQRATAQMAARKIMRVWAGEDSDVDFDVWQPAVLLATLVLAPEKVTVKLADDLMGCPHQRVGLCPVCLDESIDEAEEEIIDEAEEEIKHVHSGTCVAAQCFPDVTDQEFEALEHYFRLRGKVCTAHQELVPCPICWHARKVLERF